MSCSCNDKAKNAETSLWQYAAKLICGTLTEDHPLTPGRYSTAVNIHNPSPCDTVKLAWKVAIGARLEDRERIVTSLQRFTIGPDEAVEIDCQDVFTALKQAGHSLNFAKGWVVLLAEGELDIVAVYTASKAGSKEPEALHTERVCGRMQQPCQDLTIDLSTGNSRWTLSPDGGDDGELATLGLPANVPGLENAWAALPGALWIHDPDQNRNANTIYEICFDLCFGFEDPELQLSLMADNRARVLLNGQMMNGATYSSGGGSWHTVNGQDFKTPATVSATAGMFRAGRNCVQVVVHNDGGPTGLIVAGILRVPGGMCPGFVPPIIPCPGVCYQANRRTVGWVGPNCNGETIGFPDPSTLGKRRIKSLFLTLTNSMPGMSIEYRVNDSGTWTSWLADGAPAGVSKVEQMEVRLKNAPPRCHVRYRISNRKAGWSDWMQDGATAGDSGQRVDAFEVVIG